SIRFVQVAAGLNHQNLQVNRTNSSCSCSCRCCDVEQQNSSFSLLVLHTVRILLAMFVFLLMAFRDEAVGRDMMMSG
ncbi:hypothetical protein XENOCAPTIV_011968, partial [Xenoophorus captivus]